MHLQFCGAARIVTGSCYLISTDKSKILVDCGMFQGGKEVRDRNFVDFAFSPGEIDYVVLTHAHIDHSGLIPRLFKQGFKGSVLATTATADLCAIMLPDSGHIQETDVARKNRKLTRSGMKQITPIYTQADAEACLKYFRRVEYREMIELTKDIRVRFQDAGHILGSAMAEIWVREGEQETKVVFSGDIGNTNQPIINDPTLITEADYVIMESTYGTREHTITGDKAEALHEVIQNTFAQGGNVVIPAFAVERTQDLLFHLNVLRERGQLPNNPVFIDSPMAVHATQVFLKHPRYYDAETQTLLAKGENPFKLPGLKFSLTEDDSREINEYQGGAIIISASGMCDAGRIKHHLSNNLWRPESTVLFVGYQAEGSLGRRLVEGAKRVRLYGEEIVVRSNIVQIDGFSGHAGRSGLLNWIRAYSPKPRMVFVCHGETETSIEFAKSLQQEGFGTYVPDWQESVELSPANDAVLTARMTELGQAKAQAAPTIPIPAGVDPVDALLRPFVEELRTYMSRELTAGHNAEVESLLTGLSQSMRATNDPATPILPHHAEGGGLFRKAIDSLRGRH